MILSKINNQQEIYSIMTQLKNSFYSSIVQNDVFLIEISKKFSKYAEFYCLKQENEPIGFIAFYDNNQETKTAFLSMIIVSKEYQGKGVGKYLLNNVLNNLFSHNYFSKSILNLDSILFISVLNSSPESPYAI